MLVEGFPHNMEFFGQTLIMKPHVIWIFSLEFRSCYNAIVSYSVSYVCLRLFQFLQEQNSCKC